MATCLLMAAGFAVTSAARGGVIRPVGIEAFSEQSIFESFEGLMAGENIEAVELSPLPDGTPRDGFLRVRYGPESPFTFESGISLIAQVSPENVLVGDFALGNASYPLLSNTGVNTVNDVPFGSAYITANAGDFRFSFPTPMRRVGLHYLMPLARLQAFDGSGESLGITDFRREGLDTGEHEIGAVFIGVESNVPIESIAISNPSGGRCGLCEAIAIDGLIAQPVPEPGTVGILLLASCSFLMLRRVGPSSLYHAFAIRHSVKDR